MKKILLVDDSALMRRVLGDIIDSDSRFHVEDRANNGVEALEKLQKNTYDAVVLDVNMPQMDGITLLKELHKKRINVRVMMASTDTMEGAKVTLDALDLGALDFIHKPSNAFDCKEQEFQKRMLRTLESVCLSRIPSFSPAITMDSIKTSKKVVELVSRHASVSGSKIVAIASSTGGPKALQSVIPNLPGNLAAPVVLVQHMPVGFTASLAERLNTLSEVTVSEAKEGDVLENGHVYISMGGKHMNILTMASKYSIHYTDEPSREGVKPCANYMFESLSSSKVNEIVCVVMTGMGADGTEGIVHLKEKKKVHVITQTEDTCAVYGMPKSAVKSGLSDQQVPLDQIAQEIVMNVGVR
ncbi:MAG: chemotaxis response regulator protein-glutamate methylesterase [Lachnospiraceae bacterium]|nr:chemotaxis response regulator protein-glutamate methylesterase [Lachnospiraceae bacterium]